MFNAISAEEATRQEAVGIPALVEWLFLDRTKVLFTIITFITMIAGIAAESVLEAQQAALLFYAVAYFTGGIYGLHAGIGALRKREIDVDLLMVLAAIGALVVGAPFEGAMLLFLFSLSNVLQAYALQRTSNAIQALMKLRPDSAMVRKGGELVVLSITDIQVGDTIIVRPGERIPLDGTILVGESTVDQSSLTGESLPVEKRPGESLFAGTINLHGGLEMEVTRLAKDSAIARLIEMVSEAQSRKAQTQRVIEQAEQYYAMGVIIFTLAMIAVPLLFLGEEFNVTFYRAMTVMVAASPCAVVISTPATVLSAIGNGAKRGVLFKGGAHVERAADIKVVAFDKTGTLTVGRPRVTDIVPLNYTQLSHEAAEERLLSVAASIEQKSEHPLAQAIVSAAKNRSIPLLEAEDFQAKPGKGIHATIGGRVVYAGNLRFFEETFGLNGSEADKRIHEFQKQGKTCVLIGSEKKIDGLIAISDTLRDSTPGVIQRLKKDGIVQTVMLTGDNERTAAYIARQAGLDAFHAGLLPEDKLKQINELEKTYGPVMMVGDGVNDAPALAAAALGVAMGAAGSDVALETADIVLMGEDLTNIPYIIEISKKTRRTLSQNLIFAFGVIFVLIGAVLGFQLALPLSVIGHEGSTVLVSLNGLRLLGFKYNRT